MSLHYKRSRFQAEKYLGIFQEYTHYPLTTIYLALSTTHLALSTKRLRVNCPGFQTGWYNPRESG